MSNTKQSGIFPNIEINPESCDKEGLCTRVCPEEIFFQSEKSTVPVVVHPENCFFCGQCVAVCPGEAITHQGFDMTNFPNPTPEMDIEPEALMGFLRMRRSVRNYNQKRSVSKDKIEKLLDAARYAPTGSNAQSLEHIVIKERELMDTLAGLSVDILKQKIDEFENGTTVPDLDPRIVRRLKTDIPFYRSVVAEYETGKDPFFYRAPVLIVTHANLVLTPCPLEDATLAAYQMMLVAQSMGLGTCFIGNLYEFANVSHNIRQLLEMPDDHDILMSFTLGYPSIRFKRLVDRHEPKVRWLGW